MSNVTLWMLIVCASACTAGSIFVPPYQCRMWRVDAMELNRRRLMVDVLQSNARPLGVDPMSDEVSTGAE
ncbi:hypothetical protein [Streptomyces sp. NPDC096152]|uniref:hypothetical protein n=1 Tax=Streptomyces sp. NPDC096152 TaxID=3366078 RepID=UPI0037F25769